MFSLIEFTNNTFNANYHNIKLEVIKHKPTKEELIKEYSTYIQSSKKKGNQCFILSYEPDKPLVYAKIVCTKPLTVKFARSRKNASIWYPIHLATTGIHIPCI